MQHDDLAVAWAKLLDGVANMFGGFAFVADLGGRGNGRFTTLLPCREEPLAEPPPSAVAAAFVERDSR